jgi:hypothetical protein
MITGHWEDHSSYTGNSRAHFIGDSNLPKCPIHETQSAYLPFFQELKKMFVLFYCLVVFF